MNIHRLSKHFSEVGSYGRKWEEWILIFYKSTFVDDFEWLWLESTGDSFATIVLVMPSKITGIYMLLSFRSVKFPFVTLAKSHSPHKLLLYVWSLEANIKTEA